MADALDLGSSAARRMGSSPFIRTKWKNRPVVSSVDAIGFLLSVHNCCSDSLLIEYNKKQQIDEERK